MKFFYSLIAILCTFCQLPANVSSQGDVQKISETLEQLYRERRIIQKGTDEEMRPIFSAVQAIIEQKITSRVGDTIRGVVGCMHAPMPAIPFYMDIGKSDSKELTSSSPKESSMALGSMLLQARGLREYLSKGGIMLVAYPEGGLKQRTEEQQAIYKKTLERFKNSLLDRPLKQGKMEKELIGTTYVFQNKKRETILFSIQMTQTGDSQESGEFALWLGPLNDPLIQERWNQVQPFFVATTNLLR